MSLTEKTLLRALESDEQAHGRSGETRLDALVRALSGDGETLDQLLTMLPATIQQIAAPSSWRALYVLVGQLHVVDKKLAELVDVRISGGYLEGAATIWAGHCARVLGGTLTTEALERIRENASAMPVQWFTLIRDTQDRLSVERGFLKLGRERSLSTNQAVDLVRYYKRWSTDNRFEWNANVSKFLDLLDRKQAQEVAKLSEGVIGASFLRPSYPNTLGVLRLSERVYSRVARVADQIGRSHQRALGNEELQAA